VTTLGSPVSTLNLSARAAGSLAQLNIRYVCELVALEPRDLLMRRNFGGRSLREIQDKLGAMGLSIGMTLDGPSYTGAVLATVAARIKAVAE
jgi:DNA-directed RNA polymerase subunit alpha